MNESRYGRLGSHPTTIPKRETPGLCRVGVFAYLQHLWSASGVCSRCGLEQPKLPGAREAR